MATARPSVVKSGQRALEILQYFDRVQRPATIMEVARALSYPQSSTSELMRSLASLGYLYFNRSRRTYTPTARVAVLGSWVNNPLFRGGRAVELIDQIADRTGETVALSTGALDYHLHHIHVVPGRNPDAVMVQVGVGEPLLECPQGELLLASYPDEQIRSAIHRMNADAQDASGRVNLAGKSSELQALRERGWHVGVTPGGPRIGVVAVLLPRRKGTDRLVVSVLATPEVIEREGERILRIMLASRDELLGVGEPPAIEPSKEAQRGEAAISASRTTAAKI